MKKLFLLLPLLFGCVSARWAQRTRDEAKQACEDKLTETQQNWETDMRCCDSYREAEKEKKQPKTDVQWEK